MYFVLREMLQLLDYWNIVEYIFGWDMFVMSINAGVQVAIFTHLNCI